MCTLNIDMCMSDGIDATQRNTSLYIICWSNSLVLAVVDTVPKIAC